MKKQILPLLLAPLFAVPIACSSDNNRIQELEAENAMLKQRLDSVGKVAIELVDEAEKARVMAEQAREQAMKAMERAIEKADSIKQLQK